MSIPCLLYGSSHFITKYPLEIYIRAQSHETATAKCSHSENANEKESITRFWGRGSPHKRGYTMISFLRQHEECGRKRREHRTLPERPRISSDLHAKCDLSHGSLVKFESEIQHYHSSHPLSRHYDPDIEAIRFTSWKLGASIYSRGDTSSQDRTMDLIGKKVRMRFPGYGQKIWKGVVVGKEGSGFLCSWDDGSTTKITENRLRKSLSDSHLLEKNDALSSSSSSTSIPEKKRIRPPADGDHICVRWTNDGSYDCQLRVLENGTMYVTSLDGRFDEEIPFDVNEDSWRIIRRTNCRTTLIPYQFQNIMKKLSKRGVRNLLRENNLSQMLNILLKNKLESFDLLHLRHSDLTGIGVDAKDSVRFRIIVERLLCEMHHSVNRRYNIHATPDGDVYYFDKRTEESRWNRPEEIQNTLKLSKASFQDVKRRRHQKRMMMEEDSDDDDKDEDSDEDVPLVRLKSGQQLLENRDSKTTFRPIQMQSSTHKASSTPWFLGETRVQRIPTPPVNMVALFNTNAQEEEDSDSEDDVPLASRILAPIKENNNAALTSATEKQGNKRLRDSWSDSDDDVPLTSFKKDQHWKCSRCNFGENLMSSGNACKICEFSYEESERQWAMIKAEETSESEDEEDSETDDDEDLENDVLRWNPSDRCEAFFRDKWHSAAVVSAEGGDEICVKIDKMISFITIPGKQVRTPPRPTRKRQQKKRQRPDVSAVKKQNSGDGFEITPHNKGKTRKIEPRRLETDNDAESKEMSTLDKKENNLRGEEEVAPSPSPSPSSPPLPVPEVSPVSSKNIKSDQPAANETSFKPTEQTAIVASTKCSLSSASSTTTTTTNAQDKVSIPLTTTNTTNALDKVSIPSKLSTVDEKKNNETAESAILPSQAVDVDNTTRNFEDLCDFPATTTTDEQILLHTVDGDNSSTEIIPNENSFSVAGAVSSKEENSNTKDEEKTARTKTGPSVGAALKTTTIVVNSPGKEVVPSSDPTSDGLLSPEEADTSVPTGGNDTLSSEIRNPAKMEAQNELDDESSQAFNTPAAIKKAPKILDKTPAPRMHGMDSPKSMEIESVTPSGPQPASRCAQQNEHDFEKIEQSSNGCQRDWALNQNFCLVSSEFTKTDDNQNLAGSGLCSATRDEMLVETTRVEATGKPMAKINQGFFQGKNDDKFHGRQHKFQHLPHQALTEHRVEVRIRIGVTGSGSMQVQSQDAETGLKVTGLQGQG
eukprot:jgi/Bigna1/88822/estExt_fgenesh1_pg.C_390001